MPPSIGIKQPEANDKLINHWSKETGIPLTNFKRVNYLKGKGIRSAKWGVLHIFIPSCVLGEICLNTLNIMEDLSIKKKKYAAAFLRGLVAADGSVTLCQYKTIKSLSAVELALETEHERILYSNVMKKLDLDVLFNQIK